MLANVWLTPWGSLNPVGAGEAALVFFSRAWRADGERPLPLIHILESIIVRSTAGHHYRAAARLRLGAVEPTQADLTERPWRRRNQPREGFNGRSRHAAGFALDQRHRQLRR